jgi:hypothetical protein
MRFSHPRAKKLFEELSGTSRHEDRVHILQMERQLAREKFPQELAKLEDLLLQYNPFLILATFAFIDLTYLPEKGKAMSESSPVEQYHIELVQGLILRHEEREFRMQSFDPAQFQELRDLVCYVAYLHGAKDLPDLEEGVSKEEFSQRHFRSILKAQTKGVRNWGYEEQTIEALRQLYGPLEGAIEAELGIRISLLIDAVRAQLNAIGKRLQEHFTKSKPFMRQKTIEAAVGEYLKAFKDTAVTVDGAKILIRDDDWTFENVMIWLLHRSTSFLLTVFAFEAAEFVGAYPAASENVKQALSDWTLSLGDLHDTNREHLFLANPVWSRPIIRATDSICFWPIPTLFHGFCFEMIEALVCRHPDLREKFLKRRGEFLEQATFTIFQKKFPEARFFKGSLWENPSTKENGENDLLVLFDSIGIVVEAKSGSINAIAKRGGASIKREIEKLITAAAVQADGFVRVLRGELKLHTFETKAGPVNRVDTSKIKQFYCLNVTMEHLGTLATQIAELQAAGLARNGVPAIPSMCLADLEIALEVIETPYQFLHYLTRRVAFELNRKFMGDELDLLVFYLQTGFAEKSLPDRKHPLLIQGLSRKLDKYFMNWPGDKRFERPQRYLSNWWTQILSAIEKKDVYRRYELGCILLDMPDEEQKAFEAQFRKLCKKIKRRGPATRDRVDAMWNLVKSEISNAVVVAAPVTTGIYPDRKHFVVNFADQAMKETGAVQAVVILVDVELDHWPYSGLYLLDKSDLDQGRVPL